ncbi:hypothetical protein KJ937_02840 [Patescibacteria group bacterium]|nr:hypothetical protein [Patescibacteria group bacterium]
MDIPPEICVPICIEQGSVFNFFIDHGHSKRQSKNRYFVILNRNPKTDKVLILVTSTTQVTKRLKFINRERISKKTIVEVSAKEYSVFPNDSAFDCNNVFEVSISALVRKIEDGGSMGYPEISKSILLKLIDGVKASPLITEEIKKLL